jgi:hypothetical protein
MDAFFIFEAAMKALVLAASAIFLLAAPAFAGKHGHETDRSRHSSPPCDYFYSTCSAKFPDSVKACQILFDAAKASGGYWGEPEARKAAHPYWGASVRRGHRRVRLCVP